MSIIERNQPLVDDKQDCIDRAAIFFDDVMPQIGGICIQDYANLNELAMLLTKLRSK